MIIDLRQAGAGGFTEAARLAGVLQLQDEAESLPFVEPLERLPGHWLARGSARTLGES